MHIWSVLYIFCDLVRGGLPWMSHATNTNVGLKELVQGPESNSDGCGSDDDDHVVKDEIHQLLMGDEYHMARHQQDYSIAASRRVGPHCPPPVYHPYQSPYPCPRIHIWWVACDMSFVIWPPCNFGILPIIS